MKTTWLTVSTSQRAKTEIFSTSGNTTQISYALGFTSGSNKVNVYHNTFGWETGSLIKMSNVIGKSNILSNVLQTVVNSPYIFIGHNDTEYDLENLTNPKTIISPDGTPMIIYESIYEITISGVTQQLGGFPIIEWNKTHKLFIDPNNLSTCVIKMSQDSKSTITTDNIVHIQQQSLYGIPISELNTNHSINVTKYSDNYFTIEAKTNAFFTKPYYSPINLPVQQSNNIISKNLGGGPAIHIVKIIQTSQAYPNSNDCVIYLDLPKISEISLVSSSIPNTWKPIDSLNNWFHYWQDGTKKEIIFDVDDNSLVSQKKQIYYQLENNGFSVINDVLYLPKIIENPKIIYQNLEFNNAIPDSWVFNDTSLYKSNLKNLELSNTPFISTIFNKKANISGNMPSLNYNFTKQIVISPDHKLQVGTIIHTNSFSQDGEEFLYEITSTNQNTFEISQIQNTSEISQIQKVFGTLGDFVDGLDLENREFTPSKEEFLFDKSFTDKVFVDGNLVLAKNNTIPFSNYEQLFVPTDFLAQSVLLGIPLETVPKESYLLSFNPNHQPLLSYICIDELGELICPIKNAYTTIQWTEPPGKVVYNSHLPVEKKFDIPTKISQLTLKFVNPDNTFTNLGDKDYDLGFKIILK